MRGGIHRATITPPIYWTLPAEIGPLMLIAFFVLLIFSRKVLAGWKHLQLAAFNRFQGYEMPADQKVATVVLGFVLLVIVEAALLAAGIFLTLGHDLTIRTG